MSSRDSAVSTGGISQSPGVGGCHSGMVSRLQVAEPTDRFKAERKKPRRIVKVVQESLWGKMSR